MAFIPYFAIGPNGVLCIIGLAHGIDKTISTPADDYREVTIDLVIPAYNEEKNIIMCLESIATQTIKPTRIILVDDGSTDKTSEYAAEFAEFIGLEITLIRREKSEGKTRTLHMAAQESKADVLFVLDADTILRSENYIARMVQELYQGIGIASACGIISPQVKEDRARIVKSADIQKFREKYPEVTGLWGDYQFLQSVVNNYREELYFYLQKFIYHGEMVFFGSIINPVGCAVAYRRQYLSETLKYYEATLGDHLTSSEDIFIGFAFLNMGYRNIQVESVHALTREPRFGRFPKQIMMWSSAYFQSCYYFNSLVCTPFKAPRLIYHRIKIKSNAELQHLISHRKIREAYRQGFGIEITKKYGRPMGWFIFTSLFEKISFATIMIIFFILHLWKALSLTLLIEITIYTLVIVGLQKKQYIRNAIKSVCYSPVRYTILLFDVVVMGNFIKDLWITKNRKWKK